MGASIARRLRRQANREKQVLPVRKTESGAQATSSEQVSETDRPSNLLTTRVTTTSISRKITTTSSVSLISNKVTSTSSVNDGGNSSGIVLDPSQSDSWGPSQTGITLGPIPKVSFASTVPSFVKDRDGNAERKPGRLRIGGVKRRATAVESPDEGATSELRKRGMTDEVERLLLGESEDMFSSEVPSASERAAVSSGVPEDEKLAENPVEEEVKLTGVRKRGRGGFGSGMRAFLN